MVKICPAGMDFEPLRVERSANWGWRLISTGRLANLVHISSRQLSRHQHLAASRTPTEVVTLFLRRVNEDAEHGPIGDAQLGPSGTWACIKAYQGTMEAPSWTCRKVKIENGSLTITLSNGDEQTCRCNIDESAGTIDIMQSTEGGEFSEQMWENGVYQLEDDGQLLVATRNEIPGGDSPIVADADPWLR